MSNWPESNSSDIENRCTSVHPEDPEIRCGMAAVHNLSPAPIHADADGHWWIPDPCDALLGEGGTARRCIRDEGHWEGHHTDEDGYRW